MRTKKTFSKLAAFYKRIQRILSDVGAQNIMITKKVTRGSGLGTCYMNIAFDLNGIKKRAKLSLMPKYHDQFAIMTEYRDQLVFIVRNTQVKTSEIENELYRISDIWDIGNQSELLFEKLITKDTRVVVVEKTKGEIDQHKHIDYIVYIKDVDNTEFVVNVDVKSSLFNGKLMKLNDDGTYKVNAGEVAVSSDPTWAKKVINEILIWEQYKLNS